MAYRLPVPKAEPAARETVIQVTASGRDDTLPRETVDGLAIGRGWRAVDVRVSGPIRTPVDGPDGLLSQNRESAVRIAGRHPGAAATGLRSDRATAGLQPDS